jgi:hypothetical protein
MAPARPFVFCAHTPAILAGPFMQAQPELEKPWRSCQVATPAGQAGLAKPPRCPGEATYTTTLAQGVSPPKEPRKTKALAEAGVWVCSSEPRASLRRSWPPGDSWQPGGAQHLLPALCLFKSRRWLPGVSRPCGVKGGCQVAASGHPHTWLPSADRIVKAFGLGRGRCGAALRSLPHPLRLLSTAAALWER